MFFNRSQPGLQAAPTIEKPAAAPGAPHSGDAQLVTPSFPALNPTLRSLAPASGRR